MPSKTQTSKTKKSTGNVQNHSKKHIGSSQTKSDSVQLQQLEDQLTEVDLMAKKRDDLSRRLTELSVAREEESQKMKSDLSEINALLDDVASQVSDTLIIKIQEDTRVQEELAFLRRTVEESIHQRAVLQKSLDEIRNILADKQGVSRMAEEEIERQSREFEEMARLRNEQLKLQAELERKRLEEERSRLIEREKQEAAAAARALNSAVARLERASGTAQRNVVVTNQPVFKMDPDVAKRRAARLEAEKKAKEDEAARRQEARQAVQAAMVSDSSDPTSSDRTWVKQINEHASNANTLKMKVLSEQKAEILSFREKMLKFAAVSDGSN